MDRTDDDCDWTAKMCRPVCTTHKLISSFSQYWPNQCRPAREEGPWGEKAGIRSAEARERSVIQFPDLSSISVLGPLVPFGCGGRALVSQRIVVCSSKLCSVVHRSTMLVLVCTSCRSGCWVTSTKHTTAHTSQSNPTRRRNNFSIVVTIRQQLENGKALKKQLPATIFCLCKFFRTFCHSSTNKQTVFPLLGVYGEQTPFDDAIPKPIRTARQRCVWGAFVVTITLEVVGFCSGRCTV